MKVYELERGTLVVAKKNLDPYAANIPKGTFGVVFEEADYHEDDAGPLIRWTNLGICNVEREDEVVVVAK